MNKTIDLLTIIGFKYDKYNNFYFFKDIEYIISFNDNNGIIIVKNQKYVYDDKGAVLNEKFVIDFLNKEFKGIIRKHKIKKLL